MASATVIKALVADVPVWGAGVTPYQAGNHLSAFAAGTPTLYGVNRPANTSTTKFFPFKQTISGNKAFELTGSSPITTISTATQLRVVGILNGVIKARASGAAVAPASSFIVGAGGGTAAADATLSVKGTTAANMLAGSVLLSLASSGANTKTILPGDQFTVAGDTTVYTFTGGGTLTLNGTTEINVGITPPLQVAQTAGLAVTITAATGKTAIFADALGVGQTGEVWVNDAADIVTIQVLAASREYDVIACDAMIASSALDLAPLAK